MRALRLGFPPSPPLFAPSALWVSCYGHTLCNMTEGGTPTASSGGASSAAASSASSATSVGGASAAVASGAHAEGAPMVWAHTRPWYGPIPPQPQAPPRDLGRQERHAIAGLGGHARRRGVPPPGRAPPATLATRERHDRQGAAQAHLTLEAEGVPLAGSGQRKDACAAKAAQPTRIASARQPRRAGRGAHAPSKLAELGQEGVGDADGCSASRLLGSSWLGAAASGRQLERLLHVAQPPPPLAPPPHAPPPHAP